MLADVWLEFEPGYDPDCLNAPSGARCLLTLIATIVTMLLTVLMHLQVRGAC